MSHSSMAQHRGRAQPHRHQALKPAELIREIGTCTITAAGLAAFSVGAFGPQAMDGAQWAVILAGGFFGAAWGAYCARPRA